MEARRRVYFLQEGDENGAVKIGVSTDPERRMSHLATGSRLPLRMLGHVAGGSTLEGRLHQLLAAERERGEWFRYSDATRLTVTAALVCETPQFRLQRFGDVLLWLTQNRPNVTPSFATRLHARAYTSGYRRAPPPLKGAPRQTSTPYRFTRLTR